MTRGGPFVPVLVASTPEKKPLTRSTPRPVAVMRTWKARSTARTPTTPPTMSFSGLAATCSRMNHPIGIPTTVAPNSRAAVGRRMSVRAVHAVVALDTIPRIVSIASARSTPRRAESSGMVTSAKPNPEMPCTTDPSAMMTATRARSRVPTGAVSQGARDVDSDWLNELYAVKSTKPARTAIRTAWVRLRACMRRYIVLRWLLTVLAAMPRRSPTSSVV